MKTTAITLPRDLYQVNLHVFSDWHIGDRHCDMDSIRKEIFEVMNDKNAYVILNGDLMNNATKTSVSDCYAEELTPMEQLTTLADLLRPVKGKILCMTAGNHENRTLRNDGIDLSGLLARELGIEDRYGREGILLFLRFGIDLKHANGDRHRYQSYRIYATHGSGGGRKEGAKAIRLADMASIVNADIYIHSHTHLPMTMRLGGFETDQRNSCVVPVDRLFVNTAASLYYGGYGQAFEFKPSSTVSPIIHISGKEHRYWATL